MMKRLFLLIMALFIYNVSCLSADDVKKPEIDQIKHTISANFPFKVYNTYLMTDTLEATRIFSDSSTTKYKRINAYYLTIFRHTNPSDGFQAIMVSIDSLRYKFEDEKNTVEYFSHGDLSKTKSFFDQEASFSSLGRDWEMTYSPYGEVVKLEGESLDQSVQFLEKYAQKLDTVKKYVWYRGVSAERLEYIADVTKNLLPYTAVALDSSWNRAFYLEINGIDYADSANVVLALSSTEGKKLVGSATNMEVFPKEQYIYGIKDMVSVEKGKGKANIDVKLSIRNILEELNCTAEAEADIKYRNQTFKEKYKYSGSWKLLNMARIAQ